MVCKVIPKLTSFFLITGLLFLVKICLVIKARQRSKEMGFGPVFLSNAAQTRRLKQCCVLFYVKMLIGILGCAMYVVVFT